MPLVSINPATGRLIRRYRAISTGQMNAAVLRADAAYLAAPFETERFRFYSTELQGTPAM